MKSSITPSAGDPTSRTPGRILKWSPHTRRSFRTGLAFTSLWIIGFLAFTLYPMAASLYYSFTEYHTRKSPIWIGLGNYIEMFKDPLFYKALVNT
ncbi:MAG: carbohydrate ABC transporter permease, partial [Acidobacteriaceae bacterium]